jgi:hypothetical protein
MKHSRRAIAFPSALALAAGCKPSREQSAAKDRKAAPARFDQVKKEQTQLL